MVWPGLKMPGQCLEVFFGVGYYIRIWIYEGPDLISEAQSENLTCLLELVPPLPSWQSATTLKYGFSHTFLQHKFRGGW